MSNSSSQSRKLLKFQNFNRLRILFVTRKTNPTKGGLQRASCALFREISSKIPADMMTLPDNKVLLFLLFPFYIIYGFMKIKSYDLIYLQDGLLSILGIFWKISGNTVVVTVHGLEITYPNFLYQKIIPRAIAKMDGIVCNSTATWKECISRGVDPEKTIIIGNGVDFKIPPSQEKEILIEKIESQYGISLKGRAVLLSVGRLVERKGFHWFIESVMPVLLSNNLQVIYIVVGDGPLMKRLKQAKAKLGSNANCVVLLGHVTDDDLSALYSIADIFIMPNLPVKGDIEGFGIVGLEAGLYGLPIVANGIEGMMEYLRDGENSLLVKNINPDEFAEKVLRLIVDRDLRIKLGEAFRREVFMERSWSKISEKYLCFFIKHLKNKK